MTNHTFIKTIRITLIICGAAGTSCLADVRSWTDTQGRTMEAKFIRVDGDSVSFKKSDGMRYRFPIAQLSQADRDYIKTLSIDSTNTTDPDPNVLEATALTTWLHKNLVIRKGNRVYRHRESRIPQAEYIAFYFSASWCPPCRKFTPKLVDFYNEHSGSKDNFELVFVSSDRDEDGMENYMVSYEMPWPSIEFDEVKDKRVRQYAGTGIPCLVIVDREGEIIQHSYVDGNYKGPTSVMNKLDELLDK